MNAIAPADKIETLASDGLWWSQTAGRRSRTCLAAVQRESLTTRSGSPPDARGAARSSLAAGAPATLTRFDLSAARRTVEAGALVSPRYITPYGGRTLPGRVQATFLRGRPTVLDGKIV